MWRWLARRRLDEETREELRGHFELLTERYIRSGMAPEQARAAARRQLGNVTLVHEDIHVMNGVRWIDGLQQDLRYGIRQLRGHPVFSAVVAATLALGIGGTTAVFSVMHAVLIAPLPYIGADRLVRIYQAEPGKPETRRVMSAPQFHMVREQARSFEAVGARFSREDLGLDIATGGHPQRLRVLMVTRDYFRALGAPPSLGSAFTGADESAPFDRQNGSGAQRVILSHALWRARFGADPAVVGGRVRLSGEPYEIAGVAQEDLEDPVAGPVDAWLPYDLADDTYEDNNALVVFGRLRAGASLEQAAAELAVLSHTAKQRWPSVRVSSIRAIPLQEDVVAPSRNLLRVLLLAVVLVLLVACVNVANLTLVRAASRSQEFAVRAALGSGRGRLARQLLVESLLLALFGGVAGLALAAAGVKILQTLGLHALPRIDTVGFNPRVLLFAGAVTMITAVACGALPALRVSRRDPSGTLLHQTRSATATRRQALVRSSLAAAQLALALALLAGAGVLSASFRQLMNVDLGFRVDRVLTFDLNLPDVRYGAPRRAVFQEALAKRLAAIPGVTAAGATSRLPAAGSINPWPIHIQTGPLAGTRVPQTVPRQARTVSGAFFRALEIPVLAGRTFDERDNAAAPMRAVVSANLARAAFPGLAFDQVVGQRIAILRSRDTREIIGVVGDVALDIQGRPTATAYTAHTQFATDRNWALTHAVATIRAPEEVLPDVRAVIAALDPELVVHRPAPMADLVGRGASRERFAVVLMGAFAAMSLLLAALGLYGVLAYTVRQRTPEIGIRMALGATRWEVRALILRQAAAVLSVGVIAGLGGALLLGRWLSALVFQVSPWDVRILAATAVLLVITGLLAAWLPARRASRVEPRIAIQG